MGCHQTKTESQPVVIATSQSTPTYIKSALKKTRNDGKGKAEKLSSIKRKSSALNKSVNFDENVRIKLRTPTPKHLRYHKSSLTNKPISNEADDDYDDQISSVSSEEENFHHKSIKQPVPLLQRKPSNNIRYSNNSVGVLPPSTNVTKQKVRLPPPIAKEKPQSPPSIIQPSNINIITSPTEKQNIPVGTRFRVRRTIDLPSSPQSSSPVIPNQTPSSSYRSSTQSTTLPIQRSLPNTNAVLVEHRVPLSNGTSSTQTAYYAFNRRSIDNENSAEK